MTMTLVSTVTVGAGGAASIEFTSIPQTGTDLLIFLSARGDVAGGAGPYPVKINLNSDATTGNYVNRFIYGEPTTVASYTGNLEISDVPNVAATTNTFASASFYFPNYTGSTAKSFSVDSVTEDNATATRMRLVSAKWSGTAAITSIKLYENGGNFVQYSTASLYTITKGSGGATVS